MGIAPARFVDDDGITRLAGEITGIVSADLINGVALNNTPGGAGEILETVDTSNAHWIPAPASFAIGTSYIVCVCEPGGGIASPFLGSANTNWTVDDSAGADLALDPTGKFVTVNTDGVYQATATVQFFSDTAAVFDRTRSDFYIDWNNERYTFATFESDAEWSPGVTTAAMPLAAGAYIWNVGTVATVGDATFTVANGNWFLWVVRLA